MQHKQHSPYDEQVRCKVVALHYSDGLSAQEISDNLGGRPCVRTVYNILAAFEADGSTAVQGRRGIQHTARKFDSTMQSFLIDIISEDCSATQGEVAAELLQRAGVWVTASDVSRALAELGYTRVRTTQQAREANASLQQEFREVIEGLAVSPEHYVFIDEVAADSRVVNRDYAWVVEGFKSTTASVFLRGQRFTAIAAMDVNGLVCDPLIIEGGADMDMFLDWFATKVVPKLGSYLSGQARCVVVMDNCAIHFKPAIDSQCQQQGALAVFLPPYSPNFNPIEKLFGKLKQFFRSSRDFVASVPPVPAILAGFASITASDCEAWIRGIACYDT